MLISRFETLCFTWLNTLILVCNPHILCPEDPCSKYVCTYFSVCRFIYLKTFNFKLLIPCSLSYQSSHGEEKDGGIWCSSEG